MTIVNPDEARVWNRLKNSEEFYRASYKIKVDENLLLTDKSNKQDEQITSLLELSKLQQQENILLRKDNLTLTEDNGKLNKKVERLTVKSKRRLRLAVYTGILGLGIGYFAK